MRLITILLKYRVHLFFGLIIVVNGCSVKHQDKVTKSNSYNHNNASTVTLRGTISILLTDSYDRKRAQQLFKLDSRYSSNIVLSEERTKKLFIFNYFMSDKKALQQFFNEVRKTGFYDEKKHIEPVFKVVLKGIKRPPRKWGLNSGWQRVTKDPYQPYGFILKKVIKLEVTKRRVPHDCYLKGMPCN